jgi:hypothetical protein
VIGVAFISDRGDRYLPACIESFERALSVEAVSTVIDDLDHRLGLAGAVRAAWDWALDTGVDYLLHVEEDFLFHTPVDVTDLQAILDHNPQLANIVLKRQADPRTPEAQAGGIIEQNPGDYTDRTTLEIPWVEHKRCFSLNPCLIPARILKMGWPDGNEAEMTARCVAEGLTFGFYGRRDDPPRVEHVGWVRSAGWRL